ncbi:hypothetical protein D3C81_2143200 [compost metagenome]
MVPLLQEFLGPPFPLHRPAQWCKFKNGQLPFPRCPDIAPIDQTIDFLHNLFQLQVMEKAVGGILIQPLLQQLLLL